MNPVKSPGNPRTQVMAQQEEKEGVNQDLTFKMNDLNVVLRHVGDSIYISIENTKTKRAFSQTFSESTLQQEMQLYQPIPQILKMISAAKDENIKQLELKIGYLNTEKINKPNVQNIQPNYTKGDCLCFIVKQTFEWNQNEYIFKLLEQKRDEVEILHDVIKDLHAKIEELEKKAAKIPDLEQKTSSKISELEQKFAQKLAQNAAKNEALEKKMEDMAEFISEQKQDSKVSIAQWASTANKGNGNIVKWNVEEVKPTLNGMISRMEDEQTKVVIGIAGLYKIIFRYTSREDINSSDRWGGLYLNDTRVAYSCHYNGNAFGTIIYILNCNVNDKIKCYIETRRGNDEKYTGLIIERLGDRV